MMNVRITIVASAVLILSGLLVLSIAAGPVSAEEPIKIGLIDTYSGRPAIFTKTALAGWKVAINDFNKKGGFNGRKIEIVTFDDQYNPNRALEGARELVEVQGVDMLGGFCNSQCALAVSNYAKEKKKVLMVHIARSQRITRQKGHPYVFSSVNPADVLGKSSARYATYTGYTKWYIIADKSEFGDLYAGSFWKELKKRNPKTDKVGDVRVDLSVKDYSPYIAEIMEKKPTATFVALGLKGMIIFTKQAKAMGLFEKVRVFLGGLGDPIFPAILKKDMPTHNAFGSAGFLWYWPKTKEVKDFVVKFNQVMKKETGKDKVLPPGFVAFGGYVAARFLIEAMTKAGSTDTEKVVEALEGLSINTPVGKITMRACDHQAASPINWGKLQKIKGLPMPGLFMPQLVRTEEFYPTCAEVLHLRAQAK